MTRRRGRNLRSLGVWCFVETATEPRYCVEVFVDAEDIALFVGPRAFENKGKRASRERGAVVVRVVPDPAGPG